MRRTHCTDQDLLSLTNAKLGPLVRWRVEFHLNFCRNCRTRQAAIEAAGHSWREACLRPFEVGPERVASARHRFLARVTAERTLTSSPARMWPMGLRVGAIAAGVACAVMAGIGVWSAREVDTKGVGPIAVTAPSVPVVPVTKVRPAAIAPLVTRVPAEVTVLPPPVSGIDPREIEVNLLWALHEQHLCRTGSVVVVTSPSGVPTIRGVVETAAQLAALKILVSEEAHGPFAIEVLTSDESIAKIPAASGGPVTAPAEPKSPEGERLILAWLKGRGITGDSASAELIRVSNQAVSLANEAWVESWALQRLVERFKPEERHGLKLASQARLHEMAQSHFRALEKALREERELLTPILGAEEEKVAISIAPFADVARLSAMIQDTFAGTSRETATTLRSLLQVTTAEASNWGSRTLADWDALSAARN